MILEISAAVIGIGLVCMYMGRDDTDNGLFIVGLILLLISAFGGFIIAGNFATVKTVPSILSIPIEVTANTAVVSYGSREKDFIATHDIRIVTHPEKYAVKKVESYNSYGFRLETTHEIILKEEK